MSTWKGDEFIEEVRWLTENGMSMLLACELLGRKPENAERMFWRYGVGDLAKALHSERAWPNKVGGAHD